VTSTRLGTVNLIVGASEPSLSAGKKLEVRFAVSSRWVSGSHHEHDLEAYNVLVCHGRVAVGGDPRDRVT
jgi:hypothetical protein